MLEILHKRGAARRGRLTLTHGTVETPFFMPIATKGAVKHLAPHEMQALGAQILLSNTYHLMLRPGKDAMEKMGGLHRLMNWGLPLLTDSGGFQVFSLAKMNELREDGVEFRSHIDGAKVMLTPEKSMEMQAAIGADIVMQFDDVAPGRSSKERFEDAMERSLRWAKRCKDALPRYSLHATHPQSLFGIVQGGVHEDLRARSIEGLVDIGFDGYAIGGLSVGEPREDMYRIAAHCAERLPEDKPRYFMGGGMPEEIVRNVYAGVDMFDCVLPSRNARHGTLFVWRQDPASIDFSKAPEGFYEKVRVTNEAHRFADEPLDPHCDCAGCASVSRMYLRHLFSVDELVAHRVATMHNIRFYLRLMEALRAGIE